MENREKENIFPHELEKDVKAEVVAETTDENEQKSYCIPGTWVIKNGQTDFDESTSQ